MVRRIVKEDELPLPPPATTLEGREDQLTALAYDAVERRIANGTASGQEYVHFLKAGSKQTRLAMAKIEAENEVLRSRVKEMESRKSQEDLLQRALSAFKGYSGQEPDEDEEDEFDYDPNVY